MPRGDLFTPPGPARQTLAKRKHSATSMQLEYARCKIVHLLPAPLWYNWGWTGTKVDTPCESAQWVGDQRCQKDGGVQQPITSCLLKAGILTTRRTTRFQGTVEWYWVTAESGEMCCEREVQSTDAKRETNNTDAIRCLIQVQH
jgi:hypothetical protein